MLAMVLRWFICDMAMATEAGGNPIGSSGWGIIMKGRSNPERGEGGRFNLKQEPKAARRFLVDSKPTMNGL